MAELSLEDLRQRVLNLLPGTPLAAQVSDVRVIPADRESEDNILWVRIQLVKPDLDLAAAASLKRRIEESVTAVDDRFPSVYFNEAA